MSTCLAFTRSESSCVFGIMSVSEDSSSFECTGERLCRLRYEWYQTVAPSRTASNAPIAPIAMYTLWMLDGDGRASVDIR